MSKIVLLNKSCIDRNVDAIVNTPESMEKEKTVFDS